MHPMARHHSARPVTALVPALAATFAVLAASCGIGGGGDQANSPFGPATSSTLSLATPPGGVATTDVTVADAVDDDDADDERTIADLEAEWGAERAATAATLSAAPYGVGDDRVLIGPGGFEVDLGDCPAAWADTAGLDDETITIAMTTAQTGQYAGFNDLAVGMQAYFDYVNGNGGVDGRSVELVVRDDGYEPQRTVEAVAGLLAEDPFYLTTVGSPGSLAVYDALNEACIPHPFVVSAHPAWGDPAGHPFTTGFQLAYSTEAILWGAWIKDQLPGHVPVKVGALVIDNDFGRVYADAFEAWAEVNRDIVAEVVIVEHDPAALTVSPEIAQLAEAEPDVFLSMTAGRPCLSAVQEAERLGLTDSALALFTPSGCRQPEQFLAPAGSAGHGFWVVGGGVKSTNDPAWADDVFVRFANEQLRAAGLDPARELVGVGFAQYGWAHVEMLRLAASLPGGLTRSNLLLALRGAELDHPMLLNGVRFAADGGQDAYFIEGGEYSRYDSSSQTWFPQPIAIDLNGSSPTCSWVRLVCRS